MQSQFKQSRDNQRNMTGGQYAKSLIANSSPLLVTLYTFSPFLTTFIQRLRLRHFNYHS